MTVQRTPGDRYRVVLSGELIPGHETTAARACLAGVVLAGPGSPADPFDGVARPLEPTLEADQALALQARLQQAGVRAVVERVSASAVPMRLRPELLNDDAHVAPPEPAPPHTPRETTPQSPPRSAPRSDPRSHAEQRWQDAWANSHVDDEPPEDQRLGLYVGPRAPGYLQRFRRLRRNNRPVFALSWNWGAVPSPFLWALYRRLWGWALVIAFVEVVLPVLLLVMASYGALPEGVASLAYASVIVNRIVWPAVADYLYFRQAHGRLLRLFRMQSGYASELDIAHAGGVSRSAVLVGAAFSVVFGLFIWSLVDSVRQQQELAFEAEILEGRGAEETGATASGDGVAAPEPQAEASRP